ncbi:MAG: hypothetical protein E7049_01280 [Lentisphaerae bacterium]|jgi:hypothetical protein|nr:hypothetical protein [Lentisphaerota bacterium]
MSEEVIFEEGIDLEAIGKQYEEKGIFTRLGILFSGISKPKNTREYKEARIELQRLAAPLIAFFSVTMFVIVLIVVTAIQGTKKEAFEVTVAEVEEDTTELEEQIDEPPPDDIEPPPMEEVEIAVDTPTPGPVSQIAPVAAPPSQQVSVKPATQDTVAFVDSPVKMKSMTGSRTPGSIGAATRGGAGYGDAMTEATVMKVLWWLKARQDKDGGWGGGSSKLANTALAMLTYLAHGEYPGSPSPYRKDFGPVVEAGIQHLINSLDNSKTPVRMKGADGNEYAFLIATYALCEAYGMTKNPYCKEIAMQTLDRIVKGQSPTGGWDYKINPQSTRDDLSFAGWALQALKAGKMAGLHPEGLDECINKAIKCLKTRSWKGDRFSYVAAGKQHPGLTATGTLAMQLLGYHSESEVKKALDFMREWKPTFNPGEVGENIKSDCGSPQYYCYYATQCKYQAGMRQGATKPDEQAWQKWNAEMKKLYPSSIKDLPDPVKDWTGKDHKQGYFENRDQFSSRPVMDTCLAALQLMVYYRYLPTNQLKATEGEKADGAAAATDKAGDVDVTVDI